MRQERVWNVSGINPSRRGPLVNPPSETIDIVDPVTGEKRKSKRVPTLNRFPVSVEVFEVNAATAAEKLIFCAEGVVTDFNSDASGVGLTASLSIPAGSKLVLSFVQKATGEIVHVRGLTVWCSQMPTTRRVLKVHPLDWRVGVKLNLVEPDEKEFIRSVLFKFG